MPQFGADLSNRSRSVKVFLLFDSFCQFLVLKQKNLFLLPIYIFRFAELIENLRIPSYLYGKDFAREKLSLENSIAAESLSLSLSLAQWLESLG